MSLRHAVLGLLSESPASGYDLMKLFNASLANVWPATQSQVYGELGKLTSAGLAEVSAHGPRGRKEYAITDEGLAELRHWLAEVPPSGPHRDDSLLRVFFLGILTPLEARTFLLGRAQETARLHTELRRIDEETEWGDDMISVYGRLTLEYGLRMTAAQEEWARWAAEQIDSVKAREAGNRARSRLRNGTGTGTGTRNGDDLAPTE
ncbi:PadR family transcriptional regulator [Streptomyces sp. NPDC059080]|uniref:PadR family transcriptional regulator n=1 Tax=Streptomyces sp. NPDC059080 TaxID=3346718 RepID=UPI003691EDA8